MGPTLRNIPQVDIFGSCGNLSCPRSREATCETVLDEQYKFYLAFENSICLDYVTEKCFRRMQSRLVPIVLSRKVAEPLLPNDSFIAVDDFHSVSDLAKFLHFLNTNDTEYLKFLSWRSQWTISDWSPVGTCGFCQLCQMLSANSSLPSKTWHNFHYWWVTQSDCTDVFGNKTVCM